MKKVLVAGVIGTVMTISAGTAMAGNHTPPPKAVAKQQYKRHHEIEKRIDRQESRIRRSERDGRLLRREAAFLKDNLRGIKRSYHRANRDHYIDRVEWRRVNFLLERNSRIIRALKDSPPVRHYRVR